MTQPRTPSRTGVVSLLAAVLAATLGLALGLPAGANDLDDQRARAEAQQAATEAALARLGEQLENTDAAIIQAQAELEGIQAVIPQAEEDLRLAEEDLARLQREAAIIAERLAAAQAVEQAITAQIATDTARAEEIQVAIGRMAREAYRGDVGATSFTAVLDAKSMEDFVAQSALADTALRTQTQSLRELEQINGVNRNRQVRLAAVGERINALKDEADAKVVEADAARQLAVDRRAELDVLLAGAQGKLSFIESKRDELVAQQAEYEAQQAQLAADLAEIIRQQEAARAAAGQNPIGSTASQPFINPTSINPIYKTSDYGMRFHPLLHIWRLHAGVDLRTYCGTPIYAGMGGTVQWAKPRAGYGNQVMLNHGYWNGNSLMSSYNHLSSLAVSSGQNVSQGALLGYSGNTGTSAGCHLHFEVYVSGGTVDPWPLIAK